MTLVAIAFLAMAPIDAVAAKHTFASAVGSSIDPSDLNYYHYDGTSVSNTWDDSNAADIRHSTAFADFGVLKITGETSMLGAGASGGRATGNAEWKDNLVFTNASLTGQSGVATVTISLTGSLVESIGDNVDWVGSYASFDVQASSAPTLGGWILNMANAGPGDTPSVFGTHSIEIPFVFGEPFDLLVRIGGAAEIHVISSGGYDGGTGTAKFDLGNSLYWGGVTKVVDSGGVEVPYSVSSESGHNWALSSEPGAATPADNTTSSSSSGTCSVAPGRGSDALSGAVGLLTLLSPMAWLWAARCRGRRNR
jgi:hypothetical protein